MIKPLAQIDLSSTFVNSSFNLTTFTFPNAKPFPCKFVRLKNAVRSFVHRCCALLTKIHFIRYFVVLADSVTVSFDFHSVAGHCFVPHSQGYDFHHHLIDHSYVDHCFDHR